MTQPNQPLQSIDPAVAGNSSSDAMKMTIPDYEIVSDREVLYRSECESDVITRVQVIRIGGHFEEVYFWTNFATGRLVRITSKTIEPAICDGCNVNAPWEHRCCGNGCICKDCNP